VAYFRRLACLPHQIKRWAEHHASCIMMRHNAHLLETVEFNATVTTFAIT
jgi:hypothetical protein